MSETTGLKHNRQFDKKLKVAVGRAKVSFKRGNEDERNTRKGKNNNSKYEGGDGDFKLNRRENNGEKRGFKLDSEDRRPRFSKERFGEEGNQEKRFRTENSGFQRKRVYGDRGTGEGGKFNNAGFNSRFSREGGGYSKDNSFRERKSEGGGYTRDDSFRERRKEGGGGGYTKDGSFGERKREGGYYRDDPFRERKREGGYGRDDSFRERKLEGGYGRDDSFRERKREGGHGRDDSFRERKREGGYGRDDSFRERKREGGYGRDDSFRERKIGKGKSDGNELYDPKKFFAGRGRSNDRDGYEMGRNRKSMGNEESSFGAKRSSTRSEGNLRTEKVFSDDKLRSKEKVAFKRVSDKRGGGEDGLLQRKPSKTKPESTTKQVEEKDNKDGDRVGSLERAAKKLLRFKKDRDERSEAKIGVRKKKKRVIRIDPNDISNKRIDDSISVDGNIAEKKVDEEKEIEISKNAQFRAIQPSPTILSFVEDNLLGRRRLIEFRRSGYNIDFPVPLDNVPFSTNTERERVEDPVFRNKLTFFAAAKVSSSFPEPELPEIAFAGRSNVGKSSLLNALTRQWGVVRTSDKPGLTQTINFFTLGPKLSLVDLPGYGFAYAKEEVKDAWEELVKEYVSTRVSLKRVCLLIDTKWGMKPRDHELIHLMERSQTNYQIVLTKTDAVFPIDVARRAVQIEETLKANKSLVEPVMMVSSKTGAGIRCMRTVLSKISRFAKI